MLGSIIIIHVVFLGILDLGVDTKVLRVVDDTVVSVHILRRVIHHLTLRVIVILLCPLAQIRCLLLRHHNIGSLLPINMRLIRILHRIVDDLDLVEELVLGLSASIAAGIRRVHILFVRARLLVLIGWTVSMALGRNLREGLLVATIRRVQIGHCLFLQVDVARALDLLLGTHLVPCIPVTQEYGS